MLAAALLLSYCHPDSRISLLIALPLPRAPHRPFQTHLKNKRMQTWGIAQNFGQHRNMHDEKQPLFRSDLDSAEKRTRKIEDLMSINILGLRRETPADEGNRSITHSDFTNIYPIQSHGDTISGISGGFVNTSNIVLANITEGDYYGVLSVSVMIRVDKCKPRWMHNSEDKATGLLCTRPRERGPG